MALFLVHCTSGWCGEEDEVVVETETEVEAEQKARVWWEEVCAIGVSVKREVTEEEVEEEYWENVS